MADASPQNNSLLGAQGNGNTTAPSTPPQSTQTPAPNTTSTPAAAKPASAFMHTMRMDAGNTSSAAKPTYAEPREVPYTPSDFRNTRKDPAEESHEINITTRPMNASMGSMGTVVQPIVPKPPVAPAPTPTQAKAPIPPAAPATQFAAAFTTMMPSANGTAPEPKKIPIQINRSPVPPAPVPPRPPYPATPKPPVPQTAPISQGAPIVPPQTVIPRMATMPKPGMMTMAGASAIPTPSPVPPKPSTAPVPPVPLAPQSGMFSTPIKIVPPTTGNTVSAAPLIPPIPPKKPQTTAPQPSAPPAKSSPTSAFTVPPKVPPSVISTMMTPPKPPVAPTPASTIPPKATVPPVSPMATAMTMPSPSSATATTASFTKPPIQTFNSAAQTFLQKKADAPAAAPAQRQNPVVQTLGDDVSAQVKSGVSLADIAMAEARRRRETGVEERTADDIAAQLEFKKRIAYAIGGLILLLGGAGVAWIGYKQFIAVPTVAPEAVIIPPIVKSDSSENVILEHLYKEDVAAAMRSAVERANLPIGGVKELIVYAKPSLLGRTLKTTDGTTPDKNADLPAKLTAAEALKALGTSVPASMLRSVNDAWYFGVYHNINNDPILILRSNSPEILYRDMLAWERSLDMVKEVQNVFLMPGDRLTAPFFINTESGATYEFKDAIIDNRDVRVLLNNNGDIVFIYGFLDSKTLIMTTSKLALREAFNRIILNKLVR